MKPILYEENDKARHTFKGKCARIEVPLDMPDGTYMAMLLDADDSFDWVVQYPDGEREILFSLAK
jgi:hypothetical protein